MSDKSIQIYIQGHNLIAMVALAGVIGIIAVFSQVNRILVPCMGAGIPWTVPRKPRRNSTNPHLG